jgi:REP element-mobilizing transposase RayT
MLDDNIRPRVHAYLATIIRDLDSTFVIVGGVADHVHILFDIAKQRTAVEYVEKVKRESSKFVKTLGQRHRDFYWQIGYGMFSVSPTHLESLKAYIQDQVEHHRQMTFQEEFRGFLIRYGFDFDEKQIWG